MKKRAGWKLPLRIALLLFLIYSLYNIGLPTSYLILISIIILMLLFLKGALYRKVDVFLARNFSFFRKSPVWLNKLVVIIVFVLVYIGLKYAILAVLKLFGVDIQKAISDSITDPLAQSIMIP